MMLQKAAKGKFKSPKSNRRIFNKSKSGCESNDTSDMKLKPKAASEIDLKKLREYHESKVKGKSSPSVDIKRIEIKRNFSTEAPSTSREQFMRAKSKDTGCDLTESKRTTMYDEGDYVLLDFPFAEPGKVTRTDPISGKVKQYSKNKITLKKSLSQSNETDTPKSPKENFQSGVSASLPRNTFLHSDVTRRPRIPSRPAVDDGGYEVPLVFQRPIYMALESDSTFSSVTSNIAPKFYGTDGKSETQSCSKESDEFPYIDYSPGPKQMDSNGSGTSSFLYSLSNESTVTNGESSTSKPATSKDSLQKPINSFLASRLEHTSLKSDELNDMKQRSISGESWSSSALPSPFTDHSTTEDDRGQWSDSSDFSSDHDSYYHQIYPPNLADDHSDHDYASIDDCECTSNDNNKKKEKRSKSVKKAFALVVNGRSKSMESNKSPSVTPKLQRSNMQDMRTADSGENTWATVSTPGILKLNNFKELGKNR